MKGRSYIGLVIIFLLFWYLILSVLISRAGLVKHFCQNQNLALSLPVRELIWTHHDEELLDLNIYNNPLQTNSKAVLPTVSCTGIFCRLQVVGKLKQCHDSIASNVRRLLAFGIIS